MATKNTAKRPVGRPTLDPLGLKKEFGYVCLDKEAYQLIKSYCEEEGYRVGFLASKAVKKFIETQKKKANGNG